MTISRWLRPADAGTMVRVGLLVACLCALARTPADPDLWGHIRFGGDMVAARTAIVPDSYSFTGDRPWVNHEWLAEILMFGAWRAGGSAGLIALKLALDLGLILLAMSGLRQSLAATSMRDRFTALLVLGIFARALSMRPQLFSLLLFGTLLALLTRADHGRRRALLAVPPLMALWVNLHGGWLVGMGTLAVWLAVRFLRPDGLAAGRNEAGGRRTIARDRTALVLVGLGAMAATLASPYGAGLWRFLRETVGLARPDVADWVPIYLVPIAAIALLWLPVVATAAFIVVRLGRRNDPAYVLIVSLLAAGSFRVSRLDAFFAIAVVMLLAPMLGLVERARPRPAVLPSRGGFRRNAAVAFAAVALFVLPISLAARDRVDRIDMNRPFLPESDAARFVIGNQLHGRMVIWFDWGEYAIWHFGRSMKVSVDGRRETVYSVAALRANYDFYNAAKPGALDYPDRVRADYVWLPNAVPATAALERKGWDPVFRGPVSTILARPGDSRRYAAPAYAGATRVFPGP